MLLRHATGPARVSAVLVVTVLVLSACGASESPSSASTPQATPTATDVATPLPTASALPQVSSVPGPSYAPYTAPPSQIGQVIATEALVLRSGPGTNAGAAFPGARLLPGMRFRFLEGPATASGYGWYHVRVGQLDGWVADGFRDGDSFEPWLAHVENGAIALSATDYGTAIPQVNLFSPSGEPVVQLTILTDDDLTAASRPQNKGNALATSCGTEVDGLTWSSDGQLLAFAFGNCSRAIYTTASVAGGQQRIADGATLALSPDARWLVVSENLPFPGCIAPGCEPGPWELHLIDLATDASALLTHSDQFVTAEWPDWSPDGRTVAFTVDTVGRPRASDLAVWLVDATTGVERRLAGGQLPRWSPDGTRLAVLRQATYQDQPVIWIIGSDGADVAEVGQGYPPTWSPAGERIGYWRLAAEGIPQAVVSAPDGSDQLVAPVSARLLGWSPDGREVLIAGEEGLYRWTPGAPDLIPVLDGSYVSSVGWQPRLVPIGADG